MAYFVNANQSNEERKKKYLYCKKLGCSTDQCRYLRDFSEKQLVKKLKALEFLK